ncbi:MAG TPA: pilin [Candidatus Paceibacterota bacterium]|nr:pilin [Candidatus Paceibacterota bacterium]
MKKLGYISSAFALPLLAFAQFNATNAGTLATSIIQFINTIAVPLIFALAFIVFIWGVFRYFIMGGHDEEARDKGKSLMLWGIVGFFVMVSVWGLVNILTGTFQFGNNQQIQYPDAPVGNT